MGTDRLIYIRTDGNSKIASGHLVRCLSVALACRELGMEVCFLVSDDDSYCLLKGLIGPHSGFRVVQLNSAAFDHLEQELPEILSLISSSHHNRSKSSQDENVRHSGPIFLLDSYYVTEEYLTALRPFVKTAYIDDLQLFDYAVDLLINYDVIPNRDLSSYQSAYQNAGQLLLGASYTPLRSQFQNRRISVRERLSDILITTGGSDPYHFCLRFLQQITGHPDLPDRIELFHIKFHLVIGKLNTDREKLFQLAESLSFLELHENVADMASLMNQCDLAVSAAGTTLYELCALGLPSISFTIADNQLSAAKAFAGAGAIPYAGDMRTDADKVLQEILDFITANTCSFAQSYDKRKTAHEIMNSLVDGNGAMRIAYALKEL